MQLENGDIIDRVDINKQPAFDHPLLKNHTIQVCKILDNLIIYKVISLKDLLKI